MDVKGNIQLDGRVGADIEMQNVGGQVTIRGAYRGTLDFKNLAKPRSLRRHRNRKADYAIASASSSAMCFGWNSVRSTI